MGNNTTTSIMGKGKILCNTKQGEKRFIGDVFHVPNLKHNLISVGQLL